jgi:hypothetical protein
MARCRGELTVTVIATIVGYSGAARTVIELPPGHKISHSGIRALSGDYRSRCQIQAQQGKTQKNTFPIHSFTSFYIHLDPIILYINYRFWDSYSIGTGLVQKHGGGPTSSAVNDKDKGVDFTEIGIKELRELLGTELAEIMIDISHTCMSSFHTDSTAALSYVKFEIKQPANNYTPLPPMTQVFFRHPRDRLLQQG